jgi:hypothetical protein
VWLLWAAVLLFAYYAQLWRLFTVGPSIWLLENYSLSIIGDVQQVLWGGPSTWQLPAAGEALLRAMASVFGAGSVLLAAQVAGAGICTLIRWRPDDWREALLYRTSIGLGSLSYISLGLAALRLFYAASVQILIVLLLAGGALWALYASNQTHVHGEHRARLPKGGHSNFLRQGDGLWKTISILAVLIGFVGALAPEIEYDALWYHLWLPKIWLQHGRPVDVISEFTSLYPLTWELIFGAGLVLGGPGGAKLLHFSSFLLTAVLVYQLSLRFLPQISAWLATALFLTIPTVLWEAATAYVDLALAMHTGLAIYALLRYVEGRSREWFALAVLNLGLALATKHLGLFVLAITTIGLTLRLWLDDRSLRRALIPPLMLGVLSLLFPLPWYLRSWYASGNPVFPDLFSIFGASPPERWSAITEYGWRQFLAKFGPPRSLLNFLNLPWDMTVHAERYGGTLGPLFALLLPALAFGASASWIIPWLLCFVILYLGLWSTPLNSLQLRFLMPLTPVLAVLAAEAYQRLQSSLARNVRGVTNAMQAGLALLLLLNLPPFTSLHESDRVRSKGWLTHVIHRIPLEVVIGRVSQEEYLRNSVPSYSAWRYINTHLPQTARVLTFSGGDHLYSDRDRVWSDSTIAHTAVWGAPRGEEQRAFQTLSRLGISHVLFDKRQLGSLSPDTLAIAQQETIASCYDLVFENSRFVLYRLRWGSDSLATQAFCNGTTVAHQIPSQVDGAGTGTPSVVRASRGDPRS